MCLLRLHNTALRCAASKITIDPKARHHTVLLLFCRCLPISFAVAVAVAVAVVLLVVLF